MKGKADSVKWLILDFTIGVQLPAVAEYFAMSRQALGHKHSRDCSSGATEIETVSRTVVQSSVQKTIIFNFMATYVIITWYKFTCALKLFILRTS
jgi:hypothetical protein